MNKVKALKVLESIKGVVGLLPDGMEVLSIRPEYVNRNEKSTVHLWESYHTCPDRFYELSDRCGAEVIHGEFSEENVMLMFDVDGVTYFELVDKEQTEDD